jgi:hypothetical protein
MPLVYKQPPPAASVLEQKMFEDLKQQLLCASDLDLHYACLCVFHEMTTRRLGGRMTLDSSGNAVVITSPAKTTRAKTPKKVAGPKQEAVDTMFAGGSASDGSPVPETRIQIGEELDLELGAEPYVAVATGPPVERKYTSMHLASCDGLYSHPVESVAEPSPPRPIPTPAGKKPVKAKSRD